jgi:hypothetical protein
MPLPSPRKGQDKDSFISNCMSDPDMISEFPEQKQRAAVCYSQNKRRKAKGAEDLNWTDWDYEENNCFILW